jgi:phage terminase small subunit
MAEPDAAKGGRPIGSVKVRGPQPSEDEMRFARSFVETGTAAAAADACGITRVTAQGWKKRPAVQAAIRMAQLETQENIRVHLENIGLGVADRLDIVAAILKDPETKNNVKVELLEYIDKVEGRARSSKTDSSMSPFRALAERRARAATAKPEKKETPCSGTGDTPQ